MKPTSVVKSQINIRARNRSWSRTVGRRTVLGMRERDGKVKAKPVKTTTKSELQGKMHENIVSGSTIYSDESTSYEGISDLSYEHGSVNHAAKRYVDGMTQINGIECVWSVPKRGNKDEYHNWNKIDFSKFNQIVETLAEVSGYFKGQNL